MKKLFGLLALVLGMVSCQNDFDDTNVIVGGEQEVTINVAIPEAETRADAWEDSSKGAFENVDFTKYTIRYILQVYYEGKPSKERLVKYSDGKEVAFPVRLVPDRDYQFVVWADVVVKDGKVDGVYANEDGLHYDTSDLEEITLKKTWVAMDETRDAFTGVHTETNYTGSSNITISLTRPFAKLRVVTTDFDELAKFGIEAKYAKVEYTTPYVSTFNALEGEAVAAAENGAKKTHAKYAIKSYADETGDEHTIFSDYIFTVDPGVVKFNMEVFEDEAMEKRIKANSFNTDIQVRPNYITTLKGDVLTTGGNVTITVNPGFAQDEIVENYVDTAADLQNVIDNATDGQETVVVLGGDVDLSELAAGIFSTRAAEPAFGLEIPAGKVVTLDLKGYTISQTKEQTAAYAMILNKGTLTIKDSSANGTGKLSYADSGQGGEYASNTVKNDGVMIIDGGTIENNSSETVAATGYPHPVDNNGVLTINGGTLTNNAHYSSMRIWCTTDDNTIVTINGGTFNGSIDFQTPSAAANKGTLTITGGTFNADTYTKTAVRLLGFGADVDEMNGYISGGFFNGAIALRNWSGSEFNSQVFYITGGTFTTAAKEATDEALLDEDYTWIEAENGLWTLGLKPAVAKIGEVEYKSLQKAFDAVEEDANTIVLVDDVNVNAAVVLAEGKTATLDLNGKTLTATNYAIENNGTLTITGDGTINGVVYGENGTTTVENGTFNPADGGAYVFLNSQGGTLTINGGTINGGSSYPIYSYDENSRLVINDVTVNATFGCVNAYGTNGSVVINGGTYKMTGVEGKTSHITYFSSNIVATINGGTFEKIGDISMSATGGGGICVNGGANLTINGGTFAGDYDDVYNYGGTISVKGGEYKFEPDFVADGYVVDEIDGRYQVVKDVKVAKVGNTEYRKIDDAIAAWTNNSTLTLLSDVTLSDVITLKSTEHHTLDLGTYKMTAAEGKNAIEITCNGRSSASYAITINADANNPGGITAKGKACIYYKKSDSTKDRPIIRIYNGVFTGSYSINSISNGNTNCPQVWIYGGTFNSNVNLTKNMLRVFGGTFHGWINCTGDSSAYREISGGRFKSWQFMTADALGKFWVGTAKDTYDVGVYVDNEGYLVVGGPVLEKNDENDAKFEAWTATYKWSSYLKYSSAATNGLYFENEALAREKKWIID